MEMPTVLGRGLFAREAHVILARLPFAKHNATSHSLPVPFVAYHGVQDTLLVHCLTTRLPYLANLSPLPHRLILIASNLFPFLLCLFFHILSQPWSINNYRRSTSKYKFLIPACTLSLMGLLLHYITPLIAVDMVKFSNHNLKDKYIR